MTLDGQSGGLGGGDRAIRDDRVIRGEWVFRDALLLLLLLLLLLFSTPDRNYGSYRSYKSYRKFSQKC